MDLFSELYNFNRFYVRFKIPPVNFQQNKPAVIADYKKC